MLPTNHLFFKTREESFFQFVQEPGRCFYIPAFQRYYVWEEAGVERFLANVVDGISAAGSSQLTFLGTIICYKDNKYEEIDAVARDDVPEGLLQVVDGQQRLTSLLMCTLVMHNRIRVLYHENCNCAWLTDVSLNLLSQLSKTLEQDKNIGQTPYYPKIIRAFDDQWSIRKQFSRYISPPSFQISNYGTFYRNEQNRDFNPGSHMPDSDSLTDEMAKSHKNFSSILGNINKSISGIINELFTDDDSVENFIVEHNGGILSSLSPRKIPDVKQLCDSHRLHLLKACAFAAYLLHKVHFVALVTRAENRVYDIFETLNTTGQPLTALQTFKPIAVLFEKSDQYHSSLSKKYIDLIEEYISTIKKPLAQQKASRNITIHFALTETGTELQKNLGHQRLYLRDTFSRTIESDKHEFIRQLLCCSRVKQQIWEKEIPILSQDKKLQDEALLGLKYLKGASHTRCMPVLARYFFEATKSDVAESKADFTDLCHVIKACAAFFAIWRSTRATTDSINHHYKGMFSHGFTEQGITCTLVDVKADPDSDIVFQLARALNPDQLPSPDSLKKAFRYVLAHHHTSSRLKICNLEDFCKAVYNNPIYKPQDDTARLLLLAAMHDADRSKEEPGIYVDGEKDCNQTLTASAFDSPEFSRVSLIIASSEKNNSTERDLLNRLGNFTLISSEANEIVEKLEQEQRQLIFEILSMNSEPEARKAWQESSHKPANSNFEDIWNLPNKDIFSTLIELSTFGTNKIETWSNNICERAWAILYNQWLQ